jgi:hypothetical protein
VRFVLHELWVSDGRIPAKAVIRAFPESELLGEFAGFYREFTTSVICCPVCGGESRCGAAALFKRIFDEREEGV